jgi:AraC-like DNA-binding protein
MAAIHKPRATKLEPLPRLSVSTAGLSDADRVAVLTGSFLMALETTPLTASLEVSFDTFMLDPISVVHARSSPRRTERRRERINADGFDLVVLQLTLEGRAQGDADGVAFQNGPGDITVLDVGRPFSIGDLETREDLTVLIPRATLQRVTSRPAELHGRVFGPDRNSALAGCLRGLMPTLSSLRAEDAGVVARLILDLAALMLGARPPGEAEPGYLNDSSRETRALMDRAEQWIDANLGRETMSPADVIDGLGTSRSALYRAFENRGGVAAHITRRRLHRVTQTLIVPGETRSVADVAYAAGFRSITHFNRLFRHAYGVTPTRFREMSRAVQD